MIKINEKELDKDLTYSKIELVQKEGNRQVKRKMKFYNLDAFKVDGKLVKVEFSDNGKSAEECFMNVIDNLYR